jgi:predicted hydrocarbon binding protein
VSAPAGLEADGRGGLTLGGARYLLIRPETLVALQKAVQQALGERAGACIVAGGRAGGARAAASLAGSGEARVRQLLQIGGQIGWGEFQLERLTASELAVVVHRSPIAEAYGPSPAPVCHLIRGVLESLAATILGGAYDVVETECIATGAPACRFSTTPGQQTAPPKSGDRSRQASISGHPRSEPASRPPLQ